MNYFEKLKVLYMNLILSDIGKSSGGVAAVDTLANELRRLYGKNIPRNLFWVPFSAGGLNLKTQILYPGIMEYVAVFNAPVSTSGRSGFHWSNSSCTVLTGEVRRYNDANAHSVAETFKAGQVFRHGEFESYIYEVNAGSYVACYGRGVVPLSGLWPITGSIAHGDFMPALKLSFVYLEAYYKWAATGILGLWNTYTPRQYHAEL